MNCSVASPANVLIKRRRPYRGCVRAAMGLQYADFHGAQGSTLHPLMRLCFMRASIAVRH